MKKMILGLSAISLLAAPSCSADKELAPALTKEAVAGKYILTAVTAQFASSEQDVSEFFMQDCERDDVIHFKTDMTYTVTDEGVQCDPPTEESGPWNILDDHTIFMDDDEAEVKKWNGKELHFARPDIIDGQEASVVFKLRRL